MHQARLTAGEVVARVATEQQRLAMSRALTGTIAHEVRKPVSQSKQALAMIRSGLAELERLRAAGREADYQSRLRALEQVAEAGYSGMVRGDMLIGIILRNIREERIDPSGFEPLGLAQVVHKAIEAYAFARGQRMRVQLDLDAEFSVRGDENLLIYVLFNLLQNAFHHLGDQPDGKVTITLVRADASNRLLFADNGPGIAPERIEGIFESFVTFANKQGTGLGLPFCKRVLSAMGATIAVSSAPGQGTEFRLAFPPVGGGSA